MRYVVIAILALALGGMIGRALWGEKHVQPVDPIQVIVTELKTHAVVQHERQLAIWYRVCPSVLGKTPEIFLAWPARLSYSVELGDVQVSRSGTVIRVRTSPIHPDEPTVPTDFMDYLSTTSIFTFANEQELVNHEIGKASPVARYLTAYFLVRDPSLPDEFADELRKLVEHLTSALGVKTTRVDVDVPKPELTLPKLPKIELCEGTLASVNGLPFAKYDTGSTVPVRFEPPSRAKPKPAAAPDAESLKGIASVVAAPGQALRH